MRGDIYLVIGLLLKKTRFSVNSGPFDAQYSAENVLARKKKMRT